MKPNQSFFWSRLKSVTVDISAIYCLSILLRAILSNFIFVEFNTLFIGSLLLYYVLFDLFFNGRTAGRILTGIKVIRTNGKELQWTAIAAREVISKCIAGIILPVYCFQNLIGKQSWILAISTFIILFLFSTAILLIFKRQWWEIISGTTIAVNLKATRAVNKGAFLFVSVISLTSICIIIFPALKGNKKDFATNYFPEYPTTVETGRYTAFIKNKTQPPVDYIFDLFKKYDIVVISERLHPEYTQYQFFSDIVKDKRFIENIGNIFTECGSVSFQDTLNTYMHTSFASEDLLNRSTAILQRNSNAIWPLWDNTNLFDFFKTVNRLNSTLSDSSKINWYFTDTKVDWTNMDHAKFVKAYTNIKRDSIMAAHIIENYNNIIVKQPRKKALVIVNSRHGYGLIADNFAKGFRSEYNTVTAAYLMKQFPGRVANVLMNTFSIKYSMIFTPVQHGKWETAFANAGNPDAGFNFSGSPFGSDHFDLAFASTPGLTYKDVFKGFVFYKPLNQHIKKQGFPYEFTNFEDSILKRAAYVDQAQVESFRKIIAYKKQQTDPVDSGMVPVALLSNAVVVIFIPLLIFISFLMSLFQLMHANNKNIENVNF